MCDTLPTDPTQWLQATAVEREEWVRLLCARVVTLESLWPLVEAMMLDQAEPSSTPNRHTVVTYRKGTSNFCDFLTEQRRKMNDPASEQEFVNWLSRKGVTAMTVRTRLAAARKIRDAFAWAGLRLHDWGRASHLPDYRQKKRSRPFTEAEVGRLLEAAYIEERLVLLLGLELGLRTSEIANLRANDFSLTSPARVDVSNGHENWSLPVSEELRAVLERWIASSNGDRLLPGRGVNYVATLLERVCGRTGIPYDETGTDALRLTAGRRCLDETGNPEAVRMFLRLKSRVSLTAYVL